MMANFHKFALNFVNDFMNIQEAIIVILERVLYTISIKKQQSQYKDTSVPPFLMSEYCKNNSVLLLLIGFPGSKKKNRTPQFPLFLFEPSSLDGAQDTTLGSKRQPFFMYHFMLPW